METLMLYVINLEKFYQAFLNVDFNSVNCIKITYVGNECALITVTGNGRDLFWLGYRYK